jgi:hypothetical protein
MYRCWITYFHEMAKYIAQGAGCSGTSTLYEIGTKFRTRYKSIIAYSHDAVKQMVGRAFTPTYVIK